jgi:hypothetical protein
VKIVYDESDVDLCECLIEMELISLKIVYVNNDLQQSRIRGLIGGWCKCSSGN